MFNISIIIPLSPPSTEDLHENLTALKTFIQKYIRYEGYTVVIKQTKQDCNDETFKITLICNHSHKSHTSTATQHLNTKLQSIECLFQCYRVKRFNGKDMWELHVTHSGHNHAEFYNSAAHAIHHINDHTDSQMAEIKHGICAGLHTNQILSQMHIHDSDILLESIEIQNMKSILHWYNLD